MPEHVPVLPEEVTELLDPRPGDRILDATVGAGGHAAILLEACPDTTLRGLDLDPEALAIARETLEPFADRVVLTRLPFDRVREVEAPPAPPYDVVLADLGVSSMQLDRPGRGFSFRAEGPLDMRMDPDADRSAADLVRELDADDLADLIWRLGEERHSRRIARAIVRAREEEPIETTSRLAEIVRDAVPPSRDTRRIHPATRTFQALRIAVNDELGRLGDFLATLADIVAPGGRVGVISFHSLEDGQVKRAFRTEETVARFEILTPKPVRATDEERTMNPRSRSAKLRVARRTG